MFVHSQGPIVFDDLANRTYECSPEDLRLLEQLSRAPASVDSIAAASSEENVRERIRGLIERRLLVDVSEDETGSFLPHKVDIETNRQCNARCPFCPQSVAPKAKGVMGLELFARVLSALDEAPPIWIALNHYGEPLLDPHFRERVEMLRRKAFPLHLFTNATLLKESTVQFLSDGGLFGTVFNFPSLDPSEWSQLMGIAANSYKNARRGIEQYLTAGGVGAPVLIVVNACTPNQKERGERILEHFSKYGEVGVFLEDSDSRGGAIENTLVRIHSQAAGQRFAGCGRVANQLHVSWEGKVFLCCQDYEQSVILGDLREQSIAAIMRSELARKLRAEIYGLTPMSRGRLCLGCAKLRTHRFTETPWDRATPQGHQQQ